MPTAEAPAPPTARPLPWALRVWRGASGVVPAGPRWRMSRRLTRRTVAPDELYVNGLGFALAIDPKDLFQPLMLLGTFDPLVQRLMREHARPGSVVLEAGGHIGFFTLLLASIVGPEGRVEVFEPAPDLRAALERHVAANGLDQVTVVPAALSDARGTATFHLPAQAGWGSLTPGIWDATDSVEVAVTTLDDHVREAGIDPAAISFVKLDVEGAEPEALRGGAQTLAAATGAAVLVEFIPDRIRALGGRPEDVLALMDECGFEPWVPRGRSGELVRGTDPGAGEDVLFRRR